MKIEGTFRPDGGHTNRAWEHFIYTLSCTRLRETFNTLHWSHPVSIVFRSLSDDDYVLGIKHLKLLSKELSRGKYLLETLTWYMIKYIPTHMHNYGTCAACECLAIYCIVVALVLCSARYVLSSVLSNIWYGFVIVGRMQHLVPYIF